MSIPDTRALMLTVPAAAGLVGVHEATFRRWCEGGKVRAIRLPSGRWRIDRRDIASLIPSDGDDVDHRSIGEQCGAR